MKSIAIIPLRKGSKGIPGKNKKKLLGRPLYQWVLGEAILSDLTEIYIFSDDEDIKLRIENDYSWTAKVKFWQRSQESATDQASTESAMQELANALNYDFDIFCLLQATSPLTTAEDINNILAKIKNQECDSALSVVNTKRFIWNTNGSSLNYDYLDRPRRQDFAGLLVENGAVYGVSKDMYLKTNNRLGGKIGVTEMNEDSLIEIDEISDWLVVEQLLVQRLLKRKDRNSSLRAIILDVDGVFTNGTVITGPDGEVGKSFSLRDGMGLEVARESGLEVFVITSENSPIVDRRMEKLKISRYYKGVKDKYSLLSHLSDVFKIQRLEMAYVGDDINDLANMLSVNWSFSPYDAIEHVKQKADVILHEKGGDKAIREAIEIIIKLNNRLTK